METSFNFYRKSALITQKILGNTWPLRIIEQGLLQSAPNDFFPPLFIIGAPRTGSTLLYQLLVENFNLSYFNNIQSFFYGSPAIIAKLTNNFKYKKPSKKTLDSKYGYINGFFSPSEAGSIYKYWFGENDLSTHPSEFKMEIARKTVSLLCSMQSEPFIGKNLSNAIRLRTISIVFPKTLFLWVKRDPLYTSQSLIMMRRNLHGSDHVWASIKPPTYTELINYDPFEQVIRQINDIDEYIYYKLEELGKDSYIILKYEDLCRTPYKVLDMIATSYKNMKGYELNKKPISEKLVIKNQNYKQLTESDWKLLCDIVKRILSASD